MPSTTTGQSSQHPVRGSPPQAIFARPDPATTLSAARQRANWRLHPVPFTARAAAVLRVVGVLVFLAALIFAAFHYDEYERATRRLAQPFTEQDAREQWSTASYVGWRRDESIRNLQYASYAGAAGIIAVAGGGVYEWRRRRKLRHVAPPLLD